MIRERFRLGIPESLGKPESDAKGHHRYSQADKIPEMKRGYR